MIFKEEIDGKYNLGIKNGSNYTNHDLLLAKLFQNSSIY